MAKNLIKSGIKKSNYTKESFKSELMLTAFLVMLSIVCYKLNFRMSATIASLWAGAFLIELSACYLYVVKGAIFCLFHKEMVRAWYDLKEKGVTPYDLDREVLIRGISHVNKNVSLTPFSTQEIHQIKKVSIYLAG